ncbi:hypothetical protein DVA86_06875 [Streptomyces armeniacus]|uniref:Uncharacterized protein n=1 Tax=Streptomyces armeniacus TaxID=83291 RepID=A0A345XL99_9ACTN|nr:DUF5988 family protein [Streptomyces armeniacus]AXK32415.1 hypothetical protein DVA86_06875 [Streptomyces armeniacus]
MDTRHPNALLTGGPSALERAQRLLHVADLNDRVKILMGNRYEHFAPTGKTVDTEQGKVHVFEWSYRTRIAE